MAEGLPTPKSREQILSEMLTEYVGLTGINDLNTGSVMTQFFDVVARSVARTSGDIFQILRDFSLDRATGEALDRLGAEERVYRNVAQVSSGRLKVTDTSFQKKSTKIYSGASAPNIGSLVIKVSDASSFTPTGRIYIGRGTPNIEGPINYSSIAQVGAFWEITLDSPTKKFHNISESVILGQGGTRNIPVGTLVISPGAGATPNINYSVSSATLLLDGETVNTNVQVVAQEPGSNGNAPAGAIRQFVTTPFPGAAVINTVPFSNGADQESDDDYRDKIKKARLSRGLGTALAIKNAVLGARASDENARVTSNEIDTSNPEETILYIDNGEGYEEKTEGVGLEFIVDSAIGGEQSFQLSTGGKQTSVAKAFLESSFSTPFDVRAFDRLAILVGGIVSEHIFLERDFRAPGTATAYEIVASINNNPNLTFQATTSGGGSKVIIQAKSESNEYLQLTSPNIGVDAGVKIGFASNETNTILLYKNRQLLNKDGRNAFILTKQKFEWSNSITNGDTLIISVDGTSFTTYTFLNQDFIAEGQHSIVSPQNSLSSWANVFNKKITGITAEVNGEQLKLNSNLGPSNRASLVIDPSSTLVIKGMFSEQIALQAQGKEADFDLSRNTSQIKLKKPLNKGESLNLGSQFTRAEILSQRILGGQTTIPDTAYVWLVVDDKDASFVNIGVTSESYINVSKPGNNIVRYESTTPNSFDNVQVGDYVIIWSKELSLNNRLEGRVYSISSTVLELKVTSAEEGLAVIEGPIIYKEGFTVIRSQFAPQKIRIDAGVYNVNNIAISMGLQLKNATVTIDDDEIFVIRTNTETTDGALFIADFNDAAKALSFTKNSKSQSINSQLAFQESNNSDRQFPAFVHGKIVLDTFSDPPNSHTNTIDSDEDLSLLQIDPSGFICLSQPYNQVEDVISTECVEIEDISATTISIENSYFYKRARVDDRYHVVNGYDFGHQDSLITILDNDPANKTFEMPLFRTAQTNTDIPVNANNFRANDVEGGGTDFKDFFGESFSFDNYKVLMQAKNVIDPGNPTGIIVPSTPQDAILYRSVEWGRSGENIGIGYFYPTSPEEEIKHIVSVKEDVKINIFLKSGPARTTTVDGTTEWNVTITPLNVTTELITYSHSGIGSAPGLGSVITGDYVSIINTSEFNPKNLGSFKIYSVTSSSFTVQRRVGDAVAESDIATLENNTFSFFENNPTTAQEIVDYVGLNIANYVTAKIVNDGGLTGAGVISSSTEEDSVFNFSHVYLLDGKNFILTTDLGATFGNPYFTFKTDLSLPFFSTNTSEAYGFNQAEELKLIPTTSLQVKEFFNTLAVTGFTTLGQVKSVNKNSKIQLSTNITGGNGAVQVAGGDATFSQSLIQGSASPVGSQENANMIINTPAATSAGFHSDQWVQVKASKIQKKDTGISALNSIKITQNTPAVNFAKIELLNKNVGQRFFGNSRFHTRTIGKTFKVEKQGQFACISWDGNGAEPFFLKNNINIKTSINDNISVETNAITSVTDYTVLNGDISFEELDIGDVVTIAGFTNPGNNGTFNVLGVFDFGKKIRVRNPQAVNTPGNANEVQLIEFSNIPTVGDFTLNFNTNITSPIGFNATASDVKNALEVLPNIDFVNVTGDFDEGFSVEFSGINSNLDVNSLTVNSNSLDVAINSFERYNFTNFTDLDDIASEESLDFTNVTASALNSTNQIESYNFAVNSLTGVDMNSTRHIEDFNFTTLIGSNFDVLTVNTKKIQLAHGEAYLWFNVTDGVNIQSDPGGNGVSIRVDVVSGDSAISLASKTKSAVDLTKSKFDSTITPVAGVVTPVVINADSFGAAGNITLVADSIKDIDTLISDHNAAFPANTVSLASGDGSQVPTANIVLSGGIGWATSLPIGGTTFRFFYTEGVKTGIAASFTGQVLGMTTDVTIEADDEGSAGNSIVLTPLPLTNINTLILNHNTANPSATISLTDGDGTQVPTANISLTGGADSSSPENSGTVYTIVLNGVNAKSIQLADGLAYLWFNVIDSNTVQSDPGGNGTAIEVQCLIADNNIVLAERARDDINTAAIPTLSATASLGVLTVNYGAGNVNDGQDVNTQVVYTKIQDGVSAKSFQIGSSLAYLWFNVTDSAFVQTDPGGLGSSIEVQILLTDSNTAIATKAAAAIDVQSPFINGLKQATSVGVDLLLEYEIGGITASYDVNSTIVSSLTQPGVNAKSIQLADGLAYLWFNVTDGVNIQTPPGGSGIPIQVQVLSTDTAASVVTKAATAILTAAVVGIFNATSSINSLDVFYNQTPVIFGFDVSVGVTVTFTQNNMNNITITELVKGSKTGIFTARSEVQEGDFVTISSDFIILNQGTYNIIRRFKNSIYIDNPNVVEEEVTLAGQDMPLNYDGISNFDLEKVDGANTLRWGGNGAEPALELARPGDIITLGTDFNLDNQGSFHVLNSGEKLRHVTSFEQSRGIDMVSGQHGLLYSANDVTEYYLWFNIDSAGGDPAIFGKTGIQIPVLSTDTAAQVAVKKANIINSFFSSDFTATVSGGYVIVTNVNFGPTTNSSNVDIAGDFFVETTQVGRYNFLRFVNVNGISENNITISDTLTLERQPMLFRDYECTTVGDSFAITNKFLGNSNTGNFTVSEVLSETEVIVSGNLTNSAVTLLDSNSNKVYVSEAKPYVGYKKILFVTTNPANLKFKNIVLDTDNQYLKINQIVVASITAMSKFGFSSEMVKGVDSYKFHTGLIAEANRIVYGEPRDNTTYPGVGAAGAEIFIKAPLVRRVEVSINVRIKTGVPFSTIVEEVRNSVAALINSNPVGKPISISNIVSTVDSTIGVQAVAISSPQYDAQNDVIRINAGEKALVLDIISDILVSKID